MRLDNYIKVYNDVISQEFCDEIISEYSGEDWIPGTINDFKITEYRKCDVVYLSNKKIIKKNQEKRKKIDDKIFDIFDKMMEKYFEEFDSLKYINVEGDTGYMLLRYNTDDYVCEHVDTHSGQHRTLSCSLILNDDYEGGEISFFNNKYKPMLMRGDLLIFPSGFAYPHQVLPVKSGIRYSIVTWIR